MRKRAGSSPVTRTMSIKFKNAFILTKDYEVLKNHDLIVEKNRIAKIRPTDSIDDAKYERIVECNQNFLMPGFKNSHAHNGMVFARSLTDDVPLDKWLNERIFPLEAKLTEEDVYYFTILGIMENLASGVTTCADMYKYNETLAEVYYNVGFRVNLVDSIMKFDKKICPEERLINLNNYKGDNANLIKYTVGLHAEYTNDERTFQLVSDVIHKYKVPFFSHNSETEKEVNECKERWGGLTPTEVHEKFGLYDYGGGGYHCIYLSDNDIEIFRKHNLTVVTNPASNLKLGSGIAPLAKYLRNHIRVAIGTDGQASNNTVDMFREMYLVSNLSKYLENSPVSIPVWSIMDMAIKNSAYCIGIKDADSLEEGKLADIVLIDINKPNMQPKNIFINNIVYACSTANVKLTMVDGKILYENGHYNICEKEEYIYKKCNELKENLVSKL